MKTKLKLIVFVISILYCGITYGQNEFLTLSSVHFIKGLDSKDYLRESLSENGFTIIKKGKNKSLKKGYYEYWQYKSVVYVDIIYRPGKENYIIVRINKDFPDLAERLIQSFPHKNKEIRDDHLATIRVTNINKETSYSLMYSRDSDYVGVFIWYDDPNYFFEYTTVK
jgi:hypothetical protein